MNVTIPFIDFFVCEPSKSSILKALLEDIIYLLHILWFPLQAVFNILCTFKSNFFIRLKIFQFTVVWI